MCDGSTTKASISDAASAIVTTFGMIDMNLPMIPVISSIGTNAAIVVSTVHTTGHCTSCVPRIAARFGLMLPVIPYFEVELSASALLTGNQWPNGLVGDGYGLIYGVEIGMNLLIGP